MNGLSRGRNWILVHICLASGAWAFEFGLGAPLASLWLKDAGYQATIIGLNTSLYYLGIMLTAPFVPLLMRRWGNGCAIIGMIGSGVTLIAFPWGGSLGGWLLLRLLNGIASAMTLIPSETLVNRYSKPNQRARNFGYYAFSIALGWALGSLVGLELYVDAPRLAFVFGGIISLIASLIFHLGVPPLPEAPVEEDSRAHIPWRSAFLSIGTVWAQGFLEGGMVSLLPVYLRGALGLSVHDIGWLTSGIMIGVILFQVPVAWLADRLGRIRVLVACYAAVIMGLAFLPFCEGGFWLAAWLFLVGACSGSFYPLGLAILGEKLPEAALARVNAIYLAMNCLGSLSGPVFMGIAMDLFSPSWLFVTGELAVLLVFVLCFMRRQHSLSESHPLFDVSADARDAA